MTQRSRRHRRRGGAREKLLVAAMTVVVVVAIAVIAVTSWVLDVAAKAPSLTACRPADRVANTVLYAADGSKLGLVASESTAAPVAIRLVPRLLQDATIAIEDQRFYQHGALDPEGILRAALKDLESGRAVEGGSTITQQLVRNLCIRRPAHNLERKIMEAKLAIEYAQRHSKREILGQYLNTASYGTIAGSTAIGVGAASRIYFSRPVWRLSLEQEALLAGLPQAPSQYNPILHPGAARVRRNEVLGKMAALGYLPLAAATLAQRTGLGLDLSRGYFQHRQPYFFDYVENRLIEKYGAATVRKGGLKVYTTIDPALQHVGLGAMRSNLPDPSDPSSALVSIDPQNGEIRAMDSSSPYSRNQFNLAAQGHRQPGSTFKAFVLTAAIKQGIDPYTTYYVSKPLDLNLPRWGHWTVHTADEGYQGRINLKQATVTSDNTVFAQLDLGVGPANVAATAKSMGIEAHLEDLPAEGIGGLRYGVSPLELADAYSTLASGGIHRNPVAIRRVVFPGGEVEHPETADPRRVISRQVAYQVTRLLRDNITEGTGTAAYTGCAGQAGKTGTTDNYTDAWFSGYQPNLETAVWVGYPQSNSISMTDVQGIVVFGGTFPADIWHSLYSNGAVPCVNIQQPPGQPSWAPFFGKYTATAPGLRRGAAAGRSRAPGGAAPKGSVAVGGYNPDAYAPGVGQKPAPLPPPISPQPKPPPVGGGGGGGVGKHASGGGGNG
ncbi:MAG TPA: transglycosylase domain-containing protein [Solirubrobacterales bacterium]|nr:transglycosylase domain-containing protein [Solirubrobacterales bacterium]